MKIKGDCFEVAGKMIVDMPDETLLCHGIATGQGPVEGIRFSHGWIELNGFVIDKSNKHNICMEKEKYYKIGKIKNNTVKKYSKRESLINLLKHRNFGPW